jgi:S1-C subfamily serine protease
MQVVLDILLTIVLAYIAVTNALATQISQWLAPTEPAAITTETPASSDEPVTADTFAPLPGRDNSLVPDVLLRSVAYQQAAVSSAGVASTFGTTRDPLAALVNIFCTFTSERQIRTTTGSGYFVHRDGVILTNAHVAQYLLLETADSFNAAECVVRTGDPAQNRYRAELLYIPPAWITANAALIDDEVPMGTGERDYALLLVTESLTSEPLPEQFPALSLSTELLPISSKGQRVIAAGYPAGELFSAGPDAPLIPRQAETTITELYTFGSNLADVFSVRGTAVGAAGASGGPVVTTGGRSLGLIVTRGDDAIDGPGSLRAITLSHVDRTITEETGFTLAQNISGDLTFRSQVFREVMTPFLLTLLAQNGALD